VMQRTVATRNAGLGRLLQGRAQGADDLLRLALAQMRGRTYVADQLTIALAYAGGLGALPDADRAFLLGAWAAARAAGEVPPTQIDDRLRAMAGGEPDARAADVLRTGGVAALVDAVVRIILPPAPPAPPEPGGHVSAA
jgi:hypothetical protein